MEPKKFKPLIDKTFLMIFLIVVLLIAAATALAAVSVYALLIMVAVDLFCVYFLISPFFGYVEMREEAVFIRFGFIMKREIPYGKIRRVEKDRKLVSESMASLKCALEHVNIKYNRFDIVTVSVKGNDELIAALRARVE